MVPLDEPEETHALPFQYMPEPQEPLLPEPEEDIGLHVCVALSKYSVDEHGLW